MSECLHKRLGKHLQVLLMAVVALAGVGVVLVNLAMADPDAGDPIQLSQGTKTLDRNLEPVTVTGAEAEAFSGLPVDELFIYSYAGSGGDWRQIPVQVDEVTLAGAYTTTEDGLLDGNDEIVFMARDLGDQAQDSVPMLDDGWPICLRWYEIEVTDPLSPRQHGWAYLVHSDTLTPTTTSDYVGVGAQHRRIETVSYALDLASTHPGFDYLALSGSEVDILDRTKVRMYPALPSPWGVKTEDDLGPPPDDELVKDGPVRLIMRKNGIVAYESMVRWTRIADLTSPWDNAVRFSTDFSEAASGATFYSGGVPRGATVDGIPDTVRALPFSSWWQLSTNDGTIVRVGETDSIGGTKLNYYLDDSAQDLEDTGDQRSYGDVGVRILKPDQPLTYTFCLYFLADTQPNVGATYEDLYTHPLSATAVLQELEGKILESATEHIRSYTPQAVAEAAGVPSSTYGAEVYSIEYISQAPPGTPRTVSGVIIVPTGTAPGEEVPLIVHGHGTVGMADRCAPSDHPRTVRDLLVWTSNGYLVSRTDYVGLGTPGLHPYIVGEAEAYSMLDGARAALRFHDSARGIVPPPADSDIILLGHSQGGHAALFAHEVWESYAPELNVLGVVAFAPGSEMRYLTQRLAADTPALTAPIALSMYAYGEYYDDPPPPPPETWLQEPYLTELSAAAEEKCILYVGIAVFGVNPDPVLVFQPHLLEALREDRWEDIQPWTEYMDINTPGNYSSDVPVLVLHGQRDTLIPPEASERLQGRLCVHGTPAKLSLYADVGHMGITEAGLTEASQWIAERLTGTPASDSCAEPLFHAFIPLVHR